MRPRGPRVLAAAPSQLRQPSAAESWHWRRKSEIRFADRAARIRRSSRSLPDVDRFLGPGLTTSLHQNPATRISNPLGAQVPRKRRESTRVNLHRPSLLLVVSDSWSTIVPSTQEALTL